MNQQEAVQAVLEKLKLLRGAENLNEAQATFATEKLVMDILDYCHREDFPVALVYTAVDLVGKRLDSITSQESNDEMSAMTAAGPLSSIKMGDTQFEFAVNNAEAYGLLSDYDFSSIKTKLNLYRKVVSFP